MHPSKCLDFRGRNGEPVSDNGDGTFNEKNWELSISTCTTNLNWSHPILTAIDIIITTVWWFRNPANSPVEVGRFIIGYPIIYRVLYIPGGCLGCSSINRMLPTPLKDMFQPSLSANTVDVREFEATWTSDDACGWTWCNHIVIWYLNLKTYIIYNVLHTRYSY